MPDFSRERLTHSIVLAYRSMAPNFIFLSFCNACFFCHHNVTSFQFNPTLRTKSIAFVSSHSPSYSRIVEAVFHVTKGAKLNLILLLQTCSPDSRIAILSANQTGKRCAPRIFGPAQQRLSQFEFSECCARSMMSSCLSPGALPPA